MTDLPGWLQEIRDRADKATPGPWDMVWEDGEAYVFRGRNWNREWVASAATSDDTAFIAHARTDVPRLIEMVAEMAKVLETVQDTCKDLAREDIHCVTEACCQFIDECETVLAKYYGEVKP